MTAKDKEGNRKIIHLKDSDFYKNDNLGLRNLDKKNKLFMKHIDAKHTSF